MQESKTYGQFINCWYIIVIYLVKANWTTYWNVSHTVTDTMVTFFFIRGIHDITLFLYIYFSKESSVMAMNYSVCARHKADPSSCILMTIPYRCNISFHFETSFVCWHLQRRSLLAMKKITLTNAWFLVPRNLYIYIYILAKAERCPSRQNRIRIKLISCIWFLGVTCERMLNCGPSASILYRVSLSLEAPNYCLCVQSNSAGFSFVNTGIQVHLKHARRHFERNLVKDVHHRSVSSRNWLNVRDKEKPI